MPLPRSIGPEHPYARASSAESRPIPLVRARKMGLPLMRPWYSASDRSSSSKVFSTIGKNAGGKSLRTPPSRKNWGNILPPVTTSFKS